MMQLKAIQLIQLILLGSLSTLTSAVETINVLVCLVQWADHASRTLVTREDIDKLWNGPSNQGVVQGESISDYFLSNTYGKYKIQADVVDWYLSDRTEEYAANGNMGNSNGNGREIEDVLVPVLAAAGSSGYDLQKYADENNELHGVAFVHSGYAAEMGGDDCETGALYLNRIISKAWGVNIGVGSVRLLKFATFSAYQGICDLRMNGIGVWTHEWLHSKFGLIDLYDEGGRYNDSKVATGGIGAYGIMSYAEGQGYRQEFPGILSPYQKMELGVLDPIVITQDGTYTARASALHPDVYMIKGPYAPKEYLLIENRQPVLSDINLWQPGGIVIYHIDDNLPANEARGGPFVPGWPGNGAHYKVAVLQADGKYELEQAINNGDEGDFWKAGDILGPGNGEINATASGTYPNTDSYVKGDIVVTGLVIQNFTEISPGVWNFSVSNFNTPSPTNVPTSVPTAPLAPSRAPSTPAPTLAPVRCPQYTGPIFQDDSWMCNCDQDCENQSLFCDCAEAKACCEIYRSTSSPTIPDVAIATGAPSSATGPPSSATGAPSRSPSKQPTQVPTALVTGQPSLSPVLQILNLVTQPPTESAVTLSAPVFEESSKMSGGGIFGTVLVVLLAVGAIAYVVALQKRGKQPSHFDIEGSSKFAVDISSSTGKPAEKFKDESLSSGV